MSNLNDVPVHGNEEVVRLLFTTRMVDKEGTLGAEAFPTDELVQKNGKSVSVDVKSEIVIPLHIQNKLSTYQNPNKDRLSWGYAAAKCTDITSIVSQQGEQIYAVFKDPILNNFPPNPWDHAHAKIIRADQNFTKGYVRGYRDKLIELFQANAVAI